MCLEHSSPNRATDVDPRLLTVHTPLILTSWKQRLLPHPDQDFANYVLNGIKKGFCIGRNTLHPLQSASKNMSSARENPQVIQEYLQNEIQQGNILGPFLPHTAPAVHINCFGVISKKHQPGKWRLITDLSFPEGKSVNDSIDPKLCSLKYITVERVAKETLALGKGSLIAKIDIKAAYRLIPVAPKDRFYLGMKWEDKVYIDAMLPFGLRSAPKIFNAVADALEWCVIKEGVNVIYHYLDDFAVLGPPSSEECGNNLQKLKLVCEDLGVPLAAEKQAGPSTCIEFLGIIIDTVKQELRLPRDKLDRLLTAVQQWQARKSCTKRELESLIGTLHHACTVVCPGRSFLRQAITLLSLAKRPHHHIRLNVSFRSDMAWWQAFATQWNGCSLLITTCSRSVELTLDASGHWGCGAWCGSKWFQVQWDDCTKDFSIAIKELIPIIIAAVIWGSNWTGYRVIARCDNESIVTVLNSRYSKEPHVMSMLRTLFFIEARLQFSISSQHIAGVSNTLADCLSRNQLEKFYAKFPSAHRHSSVVPSSLLQWLLDPNMDWTSPHWI